MWSGIAPAGAELMPPPAPKRWGRPAKYGAIDQLKTDGVENLSPFLALNIRHVSRGQRGSFACRFQSRKAPTCEVHIARPVAREYRMKLRFVH